MKLSKKKLKAFGSKRLQVGKMQVVIASRVLGLADMTESPEEFDVYIHTDKLYIDGRYLQLFGGKAPNSLEDAAV